jgi:hypothetical protein
MSQECFEAVLLVECAVTIIRCDVMQQGATNRRKASHMMKAELETLEEPKTKAAAGPMHHAWQALESSLPKLDKSSSLEPATGPGVATLSGWAAEVARQAGKTPLVHD